MIVKFTDEEVDLVKGVLQDAANAEWGAGLSSPSYIQPAYLRSILEKITNEEEEANWQVVLNLEAQVKYWKYNYEALHDDYDYVVKKNSDAKGDC